MINILKSLRLKIISSKNLFLFLAETKKFTMNNLIILILFLIYSVQSENSIQINYKPITDWNRKIKISFFKESKLCAEICAECFNTVENCILKNFLFFHLNYI